MTPRITMIGAGRAGSVVARAWHAGGATIPAVISRTQSRARTLAREFSSAVATTSLERVPRESSVVILAVPDDQILPVARALAATRRSWRGVTVAHLSGARTRAELAPLAKRGAVVLALHPAFPFSSRRIPAKRLHGIGWGIDCATADLPRAARLVRLAGGIPVRIPSASRIRYHAACAVMSNFMIVLAETALRLSRDAGIRGAAAEALMYALFESTMENILATRGEASLRSRMTGPVARGDAGTVAKHLRAFGADRLGREMYRTLARQAVSLLCDDDPRSAAAYRALRAALRK